MLLSLIVINGRHRGRVYHVKGDHPTVIGRHDCDLKLNDSRVSRRHAQITRANERWWIEDLGSTNGTRVNDEALFEPIELSEGDQIKVGRFHLVVGHAGLERDDDAAPVSHEERGEDAADEALAGASAAVSASDDPIDDRVQAQRDDDAAPVAPAQADVNAPVDDAPDAEAADPEVVGHAAGEDELTVAPAFDEAAHAEAQTDEADEQDAAPDVMQSSEAIEAESEVPAALDVADASDSAKGDDASVEIISDDDDKVTVPAWPGTSSESSSASTADEEDGDDELDDELASILARDSDGDLDDSNASGVHDSAAEDGTDDNDGKNNKDDNNAAQATVEPEASSEPSSDASAADVTVANENEEGETPANDQSDEPAARDDNDDENTDDDDAPIALAAAPAPSDAPADASSDVSDDDDEFPIAPAAEQPEHEAHPEQAPEQVQVEENEKEQASADQLAGAESESDTDAAMESAEEEASELDPFAALADLPSPVFEEASSAGASGVTPQPSESSAEEAATEEPASDEMDAFLDHGTTERAQPAERDELDKVDEVDDARDEDDEDDEADDVANGTDTTASASNQQDHQRQRDADESSSQQVADDKAMDGEELDEEDLALAALLNDSDDEDSDTKDDWLNRASQDTPEPDTATKDDVRPDASAAESSAAAAASGASTSTDHDTARTAPVTDPDLPEYEIGSVAPGTWPVRRRGKWIMLSVSVALIVAAVIIGVLAYQNRGPFSSTRGTLPDNASQSPASDSQPIASNVDQTTDENESIARSNASDGARTIDPFGEAPRLLGGEVLAGRIVGRPADQSATTPDNKNTGDQNIDTAGNEMPPSEAAVDAGVLDGSSVPRHIESLAAELRRRQQTESMPGGGRGVDANAQPQRGKTESATGVPSPPDATTESTDTASAAPRVQPTPAAPDTPATQPQQATGEAPRWLLRNEPSENPLRASRQLLTPLQRIEPIEPMLWPGAPSLSPVAADPSSEQRDSETDGQATSGDAAPSPPDAQRIVFLVEASGSVIDTMPQLVEWLDQRIASLETEQQFVVLFYREGEAIALPPGALTQATDAAKAQARERLGDDAHDVAPAGRSGVSTALKRAAQYDADAIYLLCDGALNLDEASEYDAVTQRVSALLGDPSPRLHVVQFFYKDGEAMLRALAAQFDGKYQYIAPPSRQAEADAAPIDASSILR